MEVNMTLGKVVCLPCRVSHSACDRQHPCRRCVSAGIVEQCVPAPSLKRGRGVVTMTAATASYHPASSPNLPQPIRPSLQQHSSNKKLRASSEEVLLDRQSSSSSTNGSAHTKSDGHMASLLMLVIEQTREIKQEIADLRHMNKLVVRRMDALENENVRLREVIEHQPRKHVTQRRDVHHEKDHMQSLFKQETRSSSSSSSSEAITTKLRSAFSNRIRCTWADAITSQAVHRGIVSRAFPFLCDYSRVLATEPCPISDFADDCYAVFDVGAPANPQELCLSPPTFIYASPGFCTLSGYDQMELIGKPIHKIARSDRETLFIILANIFAKPASPVGERWTTVQTWQRKNGTPITLRIDHQVFYNSLCQAQWLVMVAECVTDSPHVPIDKDVLHSPEEFQRFRMQFPSFIDSLFTTTTTITTNTTTTTRIATFSASGHQQGTSKGGLPAGNGDARSQEIYYHQPRQRSEEAQGDDVDQFEAILGMLDSPRPFSPFTY